MSTVRNRQPKGIPVGGQFAADTHPEPGITLASPAPGLDPFQRYGLEQRLAALRAAVKEERLLQDALFADSVRKAAPGAEAAYIRRTGRSISQMVDHVVPLDAAGKELPIDPEEAKRLAEVDVVADEMEPGRKVKLADLDRAYAEQQSSTSIVVAAFDKANPEWRHNMAIAAEQTEAAAVQAHVDAVRQRILDQDPEAVALVVKRDEDPIYGASFRLSHAVRPDGSRSPADLDNLDDHWLQGTAFDDHVQAYLELEDHDVEELNIPLRIEDQDA